MPDLDFSPKMVLLRSTASLFRLFSLESLETHYYRQHPVSLCVLFLPLRLSLSLSLYMEEVDCKLDMQQLRWSTTRQGDPQ